MLSSMASSYDVESTFVSLGLDGSTDLLEVTDSFFPDLVSGDELVMLIEGAADMTLEGKDGGQDVVRLDRPSSFVFVERGAWHTGCGAPSARMLFITDGEGTDHRPA